MRRHMVKLRRMIVFVVMPMVVRHYYDALSMGGC